MLAFAIALASSAGAVIALERIAARLHWSDDPATAPHRKRQGRPVPAVGGAAVLVGLVAASAARGAMVPSRVVWPALLLAFTIGLLDDRTPGGLRPARLVLGQSIVAAVLVLSGWRLAEGEPALLFPASFLAAVLAMNCANTFDNADGAAASLGILGLAAGSPLLAAPLLGFLPFNLWLRRSGGPIAYLGNSGSHALGILMLVDPIARWALLLPLLDLLRLAVVRLRAGARPWAGDRRHLAHRLQKAGLPPSGVVLAMLAIAAPSALGPLVVTAERSAGLPLALGVLLTAITFAVAVRATPSPQ